MSYEAEQLKVARVIIFRLLLCGAHLNDKFTYSREWGYALKWLCNSGLFNPHGRAAGPQPELIGIGDEVKRTLHEDKVKEQEEKK